MYYYCVLYYEFLWDRRYLHSTKVSRIFRKILWPSQNIWTLPRPTNYPIRSPCECAVMAVHVASTTHRGRRLIMVPGYWALVLLNFRYFRYFELFRDLSVYKKATQWNNIFKEVFKYLLKVTWTKIHSIKIKILLPYVSLLTPNS